MARNIGEWLESLGLGRYAKAFAENEVDLSALPYITDEDLKDMGVALGARRKLLAAIATPIDAEAQAEPVSDTSAAETEAPLFSEQRHVTVLFADLAGFTQLSGELGAEATHELLNRYFETVDGIVETYGGSIDKHIGDNVMAVFGAPIAHSDDPERAVRAALDVHQAMLRLSDELGRPLRAHIGVASGQVVASGTGSEAHREYTVTGSSVNLASRLQDMAEAGQTLVSQTVHRAISNLAVSTPMDQVQVKGFAEPVSVWRLERLREDVSGAQQGAFVGRRGELRQFQALIQECLETGTGQAILVRGEAGIGKSRLIEEFAAVAEAQGFACHKALVLDFGVGKGQDAIRGLVRSLAGLTSGGNKAERAAAANRLIEEGRLDAEARVFLNDLLDLSQPLDLRALYDAMDNATRNAGKQATVARLIRSQSAKQPILAMVEDIHWAGTLTLAHLATIASAVASCPAVLVMTSRVEGDPLDQAWRASLGGSPLTTLDLQPLRIAEVEELVRDLVPVNSTIVRDCIARAEGNPLFLEQLLRNAEGGVITEVPGSIQSLVQARMDRLDPGDKQALQAASVIGQRFAPEALRALLENESYDCSALVENYLIRPEGDGYLFSHALIQEGAYSSLLQAQKRVLHRNAADWFARHDLALCAEHLDRAEDRRAPGAYLDAARAQAAAYHYERAVHLVERGLGLAKQQADRWALTCLYGDLLHYIGNIQASVDAYQKALRLAAGDVQRVPAWIGLAAGMRLTDTFEEALRALDQAEAVAMRHELDLDLSRIHHLRGNLYFPLGDMEGCLAQHRRALECAQRAGSPESEAHALGGLADAEYARGRMRTASDYFERCIALCHEHGFGRIEVANLCMLGLTRYYLGDLRGALEHILAGVEAAARVNHHRAELVSLLCAYYPAMESGEWSLIEEKLARASVLVERLGARRFEPDCLNFLARCRAAQGRRAEALEILKKAATIVRETGNTYCGARVLGYLALMTDDPREREQVIEEGKAILRSGAAAHNTFWFYRDVIEVALKLEEWDTAESYAQALEDFTRPEPLPWTDFFIARGRALAAWGRGRREPELAADLRRLKADAAGRGLTTAMLAIDEALKAA